MSANLLGLGENPFAAGHDPRLVHVTPERADILSRVRQALESGEPFVVITGETGIGKTSVVTEALAGPRLWAAVITNPSLTRSELLEEICLRFGVEVPEHGSKPKMLSRLERHLGDVRQAGDTPVLVVDEAHDLSAELLEELRLLSNLEHGGRPLLPIVLVGLPRLEARLAEPGLEQLRQRVAVHSRLQALDAEETERYIHHRVAVAGGDGAERYPRETCLEIHRLARGVPRAINALAGQAMLAASRESERTVTLAHVQASAADTWLRSVSEGAPPAPSSPAARPARKAPEKPAVAAPPEAAPAWTAAEIPPPVEAPPRPATESEVRDWVSRFVDPDNPVVIGARVLPVYDDLDRLDATDDAGPAMDDPSLPPIPGAAKPRRQAQPPERRRRARRADTTWLAVAAAAVLAAAGGVVLLPRLLEVESRTAPLAGVRPASATAPASVATQPAGTAASGATPPAALADTAAARPKRRLGLEVATYLDPYRASAESERLAEATGLSSRVLESEQGDEAYRIVLGSFGSRRRAEAAADDLIARGLVDQATVVSLGNAQRSAP